MRNTMEFQRSSGTLSGQLVLASLEPPDGLATVNDQIILACENNLAFMGRLTDGQIKLVVTSPPYNLGKDYEAKTSL